MEATKDGIGFATLTGHIEVVKYLYNKGLKATKFMMTKYNHLEVVKYLYSKGVKATIDDINFAYTSGNVVWKWQNS